MKQELPRLNLEVLQQNLEAWNEPTHGAVRGDKFYYIATSNWPSYDREWKVSEENSPQPLTDNVHPA